MIAPPELDLVSICGRCRVHGVRVCGEHGNRTSADKARAARRISPTRGFATRSSLTAGEGHAAVAEGRGRRAKRGRKRGCAQRSNRAGRRGPRPHQRRRREGRRAVESGRGGGGTHAYHVTARGVASASAAPLSQAGRIAPPPLEMARARMAMLRELPHVPVPRPHALTDRPPRAAALWIAPRAVRWTSAWVQGLLGTSSLFVTIARRAFRPLRPGTHATVGHGKFGAVGVQAEERAMDWFCSPSCSGGPCDPKKPVAQRVSVRPRAARGTRAELRGARGGECTHLRGSAAVRGLPPRGGPQTQPGCPPRPANVCPPADGFAADREAGDGGQEGALDQRLAGGGRHCVQARQA